MIKVQLPTVEHYDRSLAALYACERETIHERALAEHLSVGLFLPAFFVRPHRLFCRGDIVFARFCNGVAERCEVIGWSTKKRCGIPRPASPRLANALHVQFARWTPGEPDWSPRVARRHVWDHEAIPMKQHFNRVPLRLLRCPDELTGRPLVDPGVRASALEALQAAYPAGPVGLGSRTLLLDRTERAE